MQEPKKRKKLDMSKNDEFRYLLGELVKDLDESLRGSIYGSIYSKFAKIDLNSAKEFIIKKKNEGIISEELSKKLIDLLYKYSKYY